MKCILDFCDNKVEKKIHPNLCIKHENEINELNEVEIKDGS